ncbi:MAG: Holliday junction resolvase RuvX [Phycisphaerae bacterium]
MRLLAIDHGERRVGLAVCDPDGAFVFPLDVLHVTSDPQAVVAVAELVRTEQIEQLVVGLPLNMDGTLGAQARKVVGFGTAAAAAAGVPVVYVDERLTSFEAEQGLIERKRAGEKLTRKRKKGMLDAHAAAAILRGYLAGDLQAVNVAATG